MDCGSLNHYHFSMRPRNEKDDDERPTLDYKCITWNIRSLNTQTNTHALALILEQHKPLLTIVTETWL